MITEAQTEIVKANDQLATAMTELGHAVENGEVNLTPEQEKQFAARAGEFDQLVRNILGSIKTMLHKIG